MTKVKLKPSKGSEFKLKKIAEKKIQNWFLILMHMTKNIHINNSSTV